MGRRGKPRPSDPTGVLVVNKPVGPSSMRIVADVRRRAGGVRTGHAGTLDPLADGVLVLALGRGTKAIDRLMATDKAYETQVDLSAFTTTDDAEGERAEVVVAAPPDEAAVVRALEAFRGTIERRPPAFSAVKVEGERAYRLARAGEPPDLPARPVVVHDLRLVRFDWPIVTIAIRCGKGFYVRSLARDLGRALGTGGHCRTITRTAVGPFTLDAARTPDELPERIGAGDLLPLDEALAMVDADGAEAATAGTGAASRDAASLRASAEAREVGR